VALKRRRLVVRLTASAFVWSLGLLLAALLVPVYDQTESSVNGLSLTTATLVQADGAKVLIPVALPAVLTGLVGLAIRRRYRSGRDWTATAAWVMVGLLVVLSVLSILSLGAFVIPAVILLSLALSLLPERVANPRMRPARDGRADPPEPALPREAGSEA
jgi:hypothetical protein